MSYDHSMTGFFNCHETTTVEQLLDALSPLLDQLYLSTDEVHVGPVGDSLNTETGFFIGVDSDGKPVELDIKTSGDVRDFFHEVVHQAACNLSPLCEPGSLELRDHDTPDLDNAITTFWVGEGEALIWAKREEASLVVREALLGAGYSREQVESVLEFARQMPIESDAQPSLERPKA